MLTCLSQPSKRLTVVTLCLFFLSSWHFSCAQSTAVRATILVEELMGNTTSDGESNFDYRFVIGFGANQNIIDCNKLNNVSKGNWYPVPTDQSTFLIYNRSLNLDSELDIGLQSWEEDGCGSDCNYSTGCAGGSDENHMGYQATSSLSPLRLDDFIPGNPLGPENSVYLEYGGSSYGIKVKVSYTPPQPDPPSIQIEDTEAAFTNYNSENICKNPFIRLTTKIGVKPEHRAFINYTWEYHILGDTIIKWVPNPAYCGDTFDCGFTIAPPPDPIKGKTFLNVVDPGDPGDPPSCCFEPPFLDHHLPVWKTITGTTNADSEDGLKEFMIRSLVGLENITENTTIVFRVTADANGLSSTYSQPSLMVNLSPVAPEIGSISLDPSCPNKKSGVIHVNSITGIGEYQYNIRPGHYNNQACDPKSINSCFSAILTGPTSGLSFDVVNVPFGEYTLWLSNSGLNAGNCFTTIDTVTILKIPELSIQVSNLENVSCNGGNDGSISLGKTGGIAPFNFTIKDIGTNTTGDFPNLLVGKYDASVSDGCLQEVVRTLTIKQPNKLTVPLFDTDDASCVNPGNGVLSIEVSKSGDTNDTIVSNMYLYRLFKDNTLYTTWDSEFPTWTKEGLPVSSNYQLIVTENGSLDCNSYTKTFSIAPPDPLNISNLSTVNVRCYEGSDGNITFDGTGGSNLFTYKLSKAAGDTLTNTAGSFSDLNMGDYVLIIENDLPGCWDKATYSNTINISHPDSIAITLSKTDITCFGYDDGKISASVLGGTPGYSFIWEKFIGSSWNTISTGSNSLAGQQDGKFRLSVVDSKSCPTISNSVTIIEPDPISIHNALVKDIKCFGEHGSIDVTSAGGIEPHSYQFSLNALPYTTFTNLTPLNSGSYVVKAIDQNGCSLTDPTQYVITSPTTALDFTFNQSDYNGFNISCHGGNNGMITLTPTGGNGAHYSGYQYALDGGNYQSPTIISNINAGTHSIKAIDGRGCIVSKNILFTESKELLDVQVTNKKDVVCYGDLSGSIEVQGSGGLSPYFFNIGSSPNQSSTQFSNLGIGTYVIGVTDLNGCTANHTENIITLNPQIQFQYTITDVSCFGGSDGLIDIDVKDGVQPFQFSWVGQTSVTNKLVNVGTGLYTVTVVDNAGCKREGTFKIAEPHQALHTSITTVPVCFGTPDGEITITTDGGTSPYYYSIDNGISYQNNNVFNTGVGTYSIHVKDYNGCTNEGNAEIILRNEKKEPNFLASTKQNAQDTLIIKEISVPKPDSINWKFDPSAIVISNDQWSPQLKFSDAGTYFISMTGFFEGCKYTVTKNLTLNPYNPDDIPSKETNTRAIKSVEVSPNPNPGEFLVTVKLNKKYNLSLVVYDLIGAIQYGNSWQQTQELSQQISLPQAAAGVYLLRVVTDTDALDVRIILNK